MPQYSFDHSELSNNRTRATLPWQNNATCEVHAKYVSHMAVCLTALVAPAVYVSERRSRAEFLSREAAARGLGLAQAGEQLELPAQEVFKVRVGGPRSRMGRS